MEQAEKLQALWNANANKTSYGIPSERQEVTQAYYSVKLVALVPITFQHDEAETLENLSNDTFSAAKVNTKIIRIA